MKNTIAVAVLAVGLATPADAEVTSSAEHGFALRYSHVVPGSPAEVMEAFGNVAQWWDPQHSYSGNPDNLSLKMQAGSCFCEHLPGGGGVEHMRVVYVDPGKRLVLTGSLGPLLYEATSAVMDVQFKPVEKATRVEVTYRAAGFAKGGAAKLAPLVDKVIGNAILRFSVYATPPALN